MVVLDLQQQNADLALFLLNIGCQLKSEEDFNICFKMCATSDDDTHKSVLDLMTNAASLKQQCRLQVRRAVSQHCQGVRFVQHLLGLPLPKLLLDYISFGLLAT